METFSALLALCAGNSPVTGEFHAQRPVTRSFDVFFDLRLNKWLSKQSWGWWFEMPSCPLWRHCNDNICKDRVQVWWVKALNSKQIIARFLWLFRKISFNQRKNIWNHNWAKFGVDMLNDLNWTIQNCHDKWPYSISYELWECPGNASIGQIFYNPDFASCRQHLHVTHWCLKIPPLWSRYFQMHIFESKSSYLNSNFKFSWE